MRPAEVDLSTARAPVSSTRTFAGETLGDRRHVDVTPDLLLRRKTRANQPAHEDVPRPSLERQPADGLDGTGRLADEHDAVVRIPTQNRGGPWQVTGREAPGACANLAVKSGQAHRYNLTVGLASRHRVPRLNRCEEGD